MIEPTIEPKDFLTATIALAALSFAIFVFVFPKVLETLRSRRKSILSIDVPDFVQRDWRFKTIVFMDNFGLYFVSFTSLLIGLYFVALLLDITGYYLGIPRFLDWPLPVAFRYGIIALALVLLLLYVVALMWFLAGRLISKKPLIIRGYAEITLEAKGRVEVPKGLFNEARAFYEHGKYGQAILYAVTALEYELRRRLNLGPPHSFTAVMRRLAKAGLEAATPQQVENMIIMRNRVAHATSEREMLEQDAKQILALVDGILEVLPETDLSSISD